MGGWKVTLCLRQCVRSKRNVMQMFCREDREDLKNSALCGDLSMTLNILLSSAKHFQHHNEKPSRLLILAWMLSAGVDHRVQGRPLKWKVCAIRPIMC